MGHGPPERAFHLAMVASDHQCLSIDLKQGAVAKDDISLTTPIGAPRPGNQPCKQGRSIFSLKGVNGTAAEASSTVYVMWEGGRLSYTCDRTAAQPAAVQPTAAGTTSYM